VDGSVRKTRFRNVASFVVDLDQTIEVQGHGPVPYDLAFGGAFYAIVDADAIGLSLDDVASLVESGRAIKTAISRSVQIMHPAHPDLGLKPLPGNQ
jgi:trans-L-3-hydroxyproline dehydratase